MRYELSRGFRFGSTGPAYTGNPVPYSEFGIGWIVDQRQLDVKIVGMVRATSKRPQNSEPPESEFSGLDRS